MLILTRSLNLSDIPLGDMGLYALAQMMDEMNSLSELNLDNVMHDRWMSRKSVLFLKFDIIMYVRNHSGFKFWLIGLLSLMSQTYQ